MSGARYNADKPKLSLVLEAMNALIGCAGVLDFGLVKYYRGNWKKGLKYTEIADSLARHLTKFLAGEDCDIGPNGEIDKNYSGLPHVDHILCNALFLAEMTRIHPELDDRVSTKEVQDLVSKIPQQIHDWAKEKIKEFVLDVPLGIPYQESEEKDEEGNPFQPDERQYAFDLLCATRGHS